MLAEQKVSLSGTAVMYYSPKNHSVDVLFNLFTGIFALSPDMLKKRAALKHH